MITAFILSMCMIHPSFLFSMLTTCLLLAQILISLVIYKNSFVMFSK